MGRLKSRVVCIVLTLTVQIWATGIGWAQEDLVIADGLQVSVEYTLTLPDKTVAASNVGKAPFSYVQGKGEVLPGLEQGLVGMKAGEKRRVEVAPAQGYGEYDEQARTTVNRDQVPPNAKVGTMLQSAEGQTVQVLALSEESAVLDFNHPLAGKDLVFDVTILKVEKSEAEPSSETKE